MPLRVAEPGEVLGLSATLSSRPHEVTAEAITQCHVSFVWREDFLHLLHNQIGAALGVVQWLSHNLSPRLEQIRSLRQQLSCPSGLLHALLLAAFSWLASLVS
jgi:CRP/FNR family transcriptional regulator